jgi:hypothetical protein
MAYITASNGSLQPMFLIVMSLLLFLSAVTVSLRLYCRLFRVHKVGLDDYLIVAALAVTIGMGVMNGFHIAMGTGCVCFPLYGYWIEKLNPSVSICPIWRP